MTKKSPHIVVWHGTGLTADQPPDPAYPEGKDVSAGLPARSCLVKLDYPASGVGCWIVHCNRCGITHAVPAAGRADDPRSVRVGCRPSA